MKKVTGSFICLFTVLISVAQPLPQKVTELNNYCNFLKNTGFSGQILVAEKGKIITNQNFGYANKEAMYPVATTTVFNIASFTKQFTATAVLWLEQNGKLKTSDTLGKFWDTISIDKRVISIHQLLTHTSGFRRQIVEQEEIVSENELLNSIFSSNLRSKPGASFQYSNTGYQVLAALVEKVSGMPFEEFIRQKFLIPNGLNNTFFSTDDLVKINHKIAIGYNEWKEVDDAGIQSKTWSNTGSSNILSSVSDLYKWFMLIQDNKILVSAEKKKLFTAFTKTDDEEEYGYGWFITKTGAGKQLVYHGGDKSGYHTEFRYYPEDDRTLILITNQELFGFGIFERAIASNISKILSGTKVDFPINTTKPRQTDSYKYCGTYKIDSVSYFKIWMNAGQLTIGTWGQAAIDLLIPKKIYEESKIAYTSERSLALINAVIKNDTARAKTLMSPGSFRFYYPILKERFDRYSNAMEGNPNIVLAGTIPAYWSDADVARTYLQCNFSAASCMIYLGWNSKDIYDITVNNDRPFPLIYPLVFKTAGKCLIYNLDRPWDNEIEFGLGELGIVETMIFKTGDGNKFQFRKIK